MQTKKNRKKRIFTCKKGVTPVQIIVDFWATITIIFMIALFFFILQGSYDKKEVTIKTTVDELETTEQLLYAMQIAVEFNGIKMSFGEAISAAEIKEESTAELTEESITKLKELELLYKQHIIPAFYPDCIEVKYYSEDNNNQEQVNLANNYCYHMTSDRVDITRNAKTKIPLINNNHNNNNKNIGIIIQFVNYGKIYHAEEFKEILCDNGYNDNNDNNDNNNGNNNNDKDNYNKVEIKLECIAMAKNIQCRKKFIDGFSQLEKSSCSTEATKLQQKLLENKEKYEEIIKDWYDAKNK